MSTSYNSKKMIFFLTLLVIPLSWSQCLSKVSAKTTDSCCEAAKDPEVILESELLAGLHKIKKCFELTEIRTVT